MADGEERELTLLVCENDLVSNKRKLTMSVSSFDEVVAEVAFELGKSCSCETLLRLCKV